MKRNFARALAAATLLLVGFSAGALTGSVRGATPIECGDLDGNGTIAATDALLLLRRAIDLPGELLCPGTSPTTTMDPVEPTTTTTTPPLT